MSRAFGLVKFPNGNVYISCYDGTSDYMYSPLITKNDLVSKYDDSVFEWNSHVLKSDSSIEDTLDTARKDGGEEPVEIYSDYGGGFWWTGKASEKYMCITEGNSLWYIKDYQNGCPEWAQRFMKEWRPLMVVRFRTTPVQISNIKEHAKYLKSQVQRFVANNSGRSSNHD